jgi:hypothetical protein
VLDAAIWEGHSRARMLIEDYESEVLVVGLPLTLSGDEGPQAMPPGRQRSASARRSGFRCLSRRAPVECRGTARDQPRV